MGIINYFFGKPKPILTEENTEVLKKKFQEAYMKEAEKLIEDQAKARAQKDLGIKQKKENIY